METRRQDGRGDLAGAGGATEHSLAVAEVCSAWFPCRYGVLLLGSGRGDLVGCFVTAWLIGYVMLDPEDNYTTTVVGAIACTLAEASPFGNDNLLIPLLTGAAVEWVAPILV